MLKLIKTKIGDIYYEYEGDKIKFYDSDKRLLSEETEQSLGYFKEQEIIDTYSTLTEQDFDFFGSGYSKYDKSIEGLAEKLDISVNYLEEEHTLYRIGKYYFTYI